MDKRNIIFIIVYTLIFSAIVALKYTFNVKSVSLGETVSLDAGKSVKLKNENISRMKLVSISKYDCESSENCVGLKYDFTIDGKNYSITSIPSNTNIYGNYIIEAIDGDEDRIVFKMSKK